MHVKINFVANPLKRTRIRALDQFVQIIHYRRGLFSFSRPDARQSLTVAHPAIHLTAC